ncbi:hypothetical protein ACOI1C_00325 [Bacillus sp. DJP31]|uniref:hypothetical protein n=1 Tax=Bacillus sp. DJP31 TaxID=3409789 RepID=UPI003BB75264
MRCFILIFLLISFTGCNNLAIDPSHSNMTESEYISHHASPLSHNSKAVHVEPYDAISTDKLLENQINGKIKQEFPSLTTDVLVDGERIIVSGFHKEDEETSQGIRKAVGQLSKGRQLVIVTDDVFRLYEKSHRIEKLSNY